MKEAFSVILICILYLFLSYRIHKMLMKGNVFFFIATGLAYLGCTYLFFDLIIYVHSLLREKGIFFEFGHGDIILLEVFLVLSILALFNIILLVFKRIRKGHVKN